MASSREILAQDWTPRLVTAPGVVQKLGLCISVASMPDICAIKLEDRRLATGGLASNLVRISNQGHKAFREAHSGFSRIGTRTEEISSDGGYIDQIDKNFGNPRATRDCERTMLALKRAVKRCRDDGTQTKESFERFINSVDILVEALVDVQGEQENKMTEVNDRLQVLGGDLEKTNIQVKNAEVQTDLAGAQYVAAFQNHREKEKQLDQFLRYGVGAATVFNEPAVMTAAVAAGVAGALLSSAQSVALAAEKELDRKLRVKEELEVSLQEIDTALKHLGDGKERLKRLREAIVGVLRILGDLARELVSLLIYFEDMNTQISNLVEKHHEYVDIAEDLEEDMENDPNQSLNKYDKQSFHEKLVQMKKISAIVSAMAGLYGVVITNIVSPGFNLAVQQSHADLEEQSMSVVLYNKQTAMRDYLETAQHQCAEKSIQANKALVSRLEEIEQHEADGSRVGGRFRRRARGVFGSSSSISSTNNTARGEAGGLRNNSNAGGAVSPGTVELDGSVAGEGETRRGLMSRILGRQSTLPS